jgi:hypothetical protein
LSESGRAGRDGKFPPSQPLALPGRNHQSCFAHAARSRRAALFFDPDDIRGAHLLNKKTMPATPPTLDEVARLIAQLGASATTIRRLPGGSHHPQYVMETAPCRRSSERATVA